MVLVGAPCNWGVASGRGLGCVSEFREIAIKMNRNPVSWGLLLVHSSGEACIREYEGSLNGQVGVTRAEQHNGNRLGRPTCFCRSDG